MNALEAKIQRLIEAEGPISIALFMALCLGDAEHGYYIRQEAFGTKGDFITAPDISQLFGEMIGVFMAMSLDQLAQTYSFEKPVTLVELGPGRGTLMADVLRTLKRLRPGQFPWLEVALVETSPRLRDLQAKAIASFAAPIFHDTIASLPTQTPLLVMGNEFLDALPMRQYVKSGTHWRERMVSIKNGKMAFELGASTLAVDELPPNASEVRDGAIFEVAPARTAIVEELAHRLTAQHGSALLIDYGHTKSGFGDTLQAMRAHHYAPVLEVPGEADLTSHVDFEPLKRAACAAGCEAYLKTQGDFLLDLGLLQRAGMLGAGKPQAFQLELQSAVERLAAPTAMGDLFKVLCFCSSADMLLPPPFDHANA